MIPRAIQRLSSRALPSVVAGAGVVVLLAWDRDPSQASSEEGLKKDIGALPIFKRAEVAKHTTPDSRIWVTYKDGVYDITDFVANHPGGSDKIVLAAGKAIDPFWRIYQAHLNSAAAKELLQGMRVGTLDPSEPAVAVDHSDPYSRDPERHPALVMHNLRPCNAEVPPQLQTQSWVTPNELWFVRHHHPVPDLDGTAWRLAVSVGEDGTGAPEALGLGSLRTRYPRTEVTATVQCGGNRRAGLDEVAKTAGIGWGTGAISTAAFGGVLLRDFLADRGVTPKSAEARGLRHVIFRGADGMEASIPIEKALSDYGDVLLAYEMNGRPLPRDHGYPLRAVVPGHVGVRNVKWVTEVAVSTEEAVGPWQRGIAYKGFSPMVKSFEGIDVERILSMQEMPVQSVISSPNAATAGAVEAGDESVALSGWAWSGGGRGIVRVDVSADGGRTWTTADLGEGSAQHPARAWAWTFWEAEVALPAPAEAGQAVELLCRATDASYNVQPERAEPFWNKRGLNNNSWHRIKVDVPRPAPALEK